MVETRGKQLVGDGGQEAYQINNVATFFPFGDSAPSLSKCVSVNNCIFFRIFLVGYTLCCQTPCESTAGMFLLVAFILQSSSLLSCWLVQLEQCFVVNHLVLSLQSYGSILHTALVSFVLIPWGISTVGFNSICTHL
jgi:hypothetical protein